MASFSFSNIAIRAISTAVPVDVKKFDLSDRQAARFVKQMGIEQVHISLYEQTIVDLGYVALKQALAKANWSTDDLDLLIVNTQSPDFAGGAGDAALLHYYMGLKESCAFFDTSMGCAAVPTLLTIAGSLLNNQQQPKRIAIVTGDTMWNQYRDKLSIESKTHMLAGDSASVLLIEKQESAPTIETMLFGDGSGYKHLIFLAGVKSVWHQSDSYIVPDGAQVSIDNSTQWSGYMNGIAIHEFATGRVCESIKKYYNDKLNSYDYVVFHQANKQIVKTLATKLQLDSSKVLSSLDRYGNNSSASPLLVICDHLSKLDHDVHIFNASFGIGLSWGFSDFVLSPDVVCPIIETEQHFTEHMLKPV